MFFCLSLSCVDSLCGSARKMLLISSIIGEISARVCICDVVSCVS